VPTPENLFDGTWTAPEKPKVKPVEFLPALFRSSDAGLLPVRAAYTEGPKKDRIVPCFARKADGQLVDRTGQELSNMSQINEEELFGDVTIVPIRENDFVDESSISKQAFGAADLNHTADECLLGCRETLEEAGRSGVFYLHLMSCSNVDKRTYLKVTTAKGQITWKLDPFKTAMKQVTVVREFVCRMKFKAVTTDISCSIELWKMPAMGKHQKLSEWTFSAPLDGALTTHDGQLKQKNGESSVKVMTRFVPLTFQGIETTAPTWEMPTLRVCLPRTSYFVGEVIRGMIVLSSSVDQIFAEELLLQLVGEQRIQAANMEGAIEKRVFYHETRQLLV
jgi:hypothetical protein